MDLLTAGIISGTSLYDKSTPVAVECVIKWCVKKNKSEFVNGDLLEKVINRFKNNPQMGTNRLDWDAS